jgi:hypothetical protein
MSAWSAVILCFLAMPPMYDQTRPSISDAIQGSRFLVLKMQ